MKRLLEGDATPDKKALKKAKRAKKNPPVFLYAVSSLKDRMAQLREVQQLVLFLSAGDERKHPSWIVPQNTQHLERVVVVFIPGIDFDQIGLDPSTKSRANGVPFSIASPNAKLVALQKIFSNACPVVTPGDKYRMFSPFGSFLKCNIPEDEKKARAKERENTQTSAAETSFAEYICTPSVLASEGYPMVSYNVNTGEPNGCSLLDGFQETPFSQPTGHKQVLALDCEMCRIASGDLQLSRISIVNYDGETVLDEFIKPTHPITDYLTPFSGITEEILNEKASWSFQDVSRYLREKLTIDTVLLGHSLESDLKILKHAHPTVIDTALLYNHPRGLPYKPSLKWLASKWLNKNIQLETATQLSNHGDANSVLGHDSVQDSLTCVELLKLKVEKGPGFGEFHTDTESIFTRIRRSAPDHKTCFVDRAQKNENWLGSEADLNIGCSSDSEIIDSVLEQAPSHALTVARLSELAQAKGWFQPQPDQSSDAADGVESAENNDDNVKRPKLDNGPPSLEDSTNHTNALISRLHDGLPPMTALVILSGQDDPRPMLQLNSKRMEFLKSQTQKCDDPSNPPTWYEEDNRELLRSVQDARTGLALFCVKT